MKLARSYSSLSLLAECSQKFAFQKVHLLERPGISLPMHTGSALHAGLAVLYKDSWDEKLAREAVAEEWGDVKPTPGAKHPWLTKGFALARISAYMREREENPTVLETGEAIPGMVEERLSTQWANALGELVEYEGFCDLPLRVGRTNYVVDHKCSTGWVNSHWMKQFQVGHQLRGYAALMGNLLGVVFRKGLINAIYIGEKALDPPEKWEKRKSSPSVVNEVSFTTAQIEAAHAWVRGLQAQQRFHESEGFWPKNEKACGNYGGCEFIDLCTAPSPMVMQARMMTNFKRREER